MNTVSTGQLQFQVYKTSAIADAEDKSGFCWRTDPDNFLGNFRFFASGIVLFWFWSFRFLFLLLTSRPITIKQFFSLLIERIMTFDGTCCYFLRSDSGRWATFSKTFLQMRRKSKTYQIKANNYVMIFNT